MATGTWARPGLASTYLRNHEASGKLIVSFSQDPKSFPIARYAKYQTVTKDTGYYLRFRNDERARIRNADLRDFYWADGQKAPERDPTEDFRWEDYRTRRYIFPFGFGQKAVDQADFPLMNITQEMAAHQAMVGRTLKGATLLQTEAKWDLDCSGHYSDVTSIDGVADYWDVSTVSEANIERSLMYALEKIEVDTFGRVQQKDLLLLMNPATARRIAVSPEIKDFVKQQSGAPEVIQGKASWIGEYGLPKYLFGFETLVERTFYIPENAGATTQTRTFCLDDGNAFLVSRPGAVTGSVGASAFSTLMYFFQEELTVMQKLDSDDRRYIGRVIEDYDVQLAAPRAGFWFQNVYNTSSS